ncbi:MAG TPA: class II aldolase/adducin family protein [Gaiellaceae bacterium]|nr:class II aldolase/adducin family protein [Gaiellaceae bacterium]
MDYTFIGTASSPNHQAFADELRAALERAGFERAPEGDSDVDLVINVADYETARPFRRKSKGTYVAALHELDETPATLEDGLAASYPMLVRALANIVLALTPGPAVRFTTMERGNYVVEAPTNTELADRVVERLKPLAMSRLVIDNEFRPDLEPELWDGDELTAELSEVGARLGTLDLLPSPFPIEDLLSERDLRHVKRLYGVGGLSYGNLSIRKDGRRFWMSASGVDKSKLEQPGRDILLVSDYDQVNGRMVLSVPPGVEPRRVSVDAIEHWMIYQAHPEVGAILHLHAWVEGIRGTEINYPCGTEELAESVAELIEQEPDPGHAIVGLRNHGITATGESLAETLDRIMPRLLRQVPMA